MSDRRAELIAAALASDLSEQEAAELERMRANDPTIDAELAELGIVVDRLRTVQYPGEAGYLEDPPAADLRSAVLAIPEQEHRQGTEPSERSAVADTGRTESAAGPEQARDPGDRGRRSVRRVLALVACFALGIAVAVGAIEWSERPPDGPPGTLGAVEDVRFDGVPPQVRIDGALIAHTWGTESVLEIDGLGAGESFVVVLIATDGTEYDSGTFFGSDVTIDCRMNAAVMRDQVQRLEIRQDDGDLIASADLPDAVES